MNQGTKMIKLKAFFPALTVALLLSSAAFGADVSGRWKGSMPGREGNSRDVSFDFKVDSAKLTGKFIGPLGRSIDITDGKIEGDNLSFKVALEVGGTAYNMNYNGKISGDEIQMKVIREGAPRSSEFTLKRAGS